MQKKLTIAKCLKKGIHREIEEEIPCEIQTSVKSNDEFTHAINQDMDKPICDEIIDDEIV